MPYSPVDLRSRRRLALSSASGLGLLVVSGGLVRLTGSGLGCPDWPSCARTSFVGALSFHKDLEFGNRVLSVMVTVLVAVTVLAILRLKPLRRDLALPAVLLGAGVVVQIPLGGLLVLSHLWPPFVMAHFLISEALVITAVVMYSRCGRDGKGPAVPTVGRAFVHLSRLLVASAVAVVVIGTAVSGSGPHGGSRGIARLPLPYRGMTELHSTMVAFLVGLVVATLFATWITGASRAVVLRAEVVLGAVALQAAIGYSQVFLRVPAWLVGAHLAGATAVLGAVVYFHLGLFSPVREQGVDPAPERPLVAAQSTL